MLQNCLSPSERPISRWTWVNWYQNVSILDFIGAKGCNNWSYKLQWNRHHQQTNTQFFTGRCPSHHPTKCQSTEGDNWCCKTVTMKHTLDNIIPRGVRRCHHLTVALVQCTPGFHQHLTGSSDTMCHLVTNFVKISLVSMSFCYQTNKLTNAYENITSLADVINILQW